MDKSLDGQSEMWPMDGRILFIMLNLQSRANCCNLFMSVCLSLNVASPNQLFSSYPFFFDGEKVNEPRG
jgi:hypothetical protein